MAFGFPLNPGIGDKYTIGTTTYEWNGTAWQKFSGPIVVTTIEAFGTATIYRSTNAISTTTGALVVAGGAGIGKNLYVGGNLNVTGTITGNIIGNISGVSTTATNLADGVPNAIVYQSNTGTTTFLSPTTSGYILQTNGSVSPPSWVSVTDITAGTATNIENGAAGEIPYQTGPNETSFVSAGIVGTVLISQGTSAPTWNNTLTLSGTTSATSTTTGALVVNGGVGIGGDLWIGGQLYSDGQPVLTTSMFIESVVDGIDIDVVSTVVGENTLLTINNVSTLQSVTDRGSTTTNKIKILNSSTSLTEKELNSLFVAGGIGISKDIIIGGTVVAGLNQAETTGTVVNAFYSNNTLLSSFTSNVISGSATTNLDFWDITLYRSARYFAQIIDGNDIHISEVVLFHNGTVPYISEYGILTNNGQLGVFETAIETGNIVLKFKPNAATNMVIKMSRTTITI